jgi:23S rRNA-/tRNA-specific pseudouridylate synthase
MLLLLVFVAFYGEESVAAAFLLSSPWKHSMISRPYASSSSSSSSSTPIAIQIKHRLFLLNPRRATKNDSMSLTDDAATVFVSTSITDDSTVSPPVVTTTSQFEKQYYDADQDEILVANAKSLPRGSKAGFAVVHHFTYQPTEADWQLLLQTLPPKDVTRLHLSRDNVTLPIALMMMDPIKYPTISRARKFCRHGRILLHKGPLGLDDELNSQQQTIFLPDKVTMGQVGDRVITGDVIGRQVAVGTGGYFAAQQQKKPPPFEMPIVYQDDHIALVNKPAGVVVYSPKNAGQGILTVKAALPHILQPPSAGTLSALQRPKSVHRLDKATSGILLIGKTLPSMEHLSRQFENRIIQKTYTAVVNGNPNNVNHHNVVNGNSTTLVTSITSHQAYHDYHVDVDPKSKDTWHVIDTPLDGKQAVTLWRILRQVPSLRARDNLLTLVEVKPKTGRYHQIRRHMVNESAEISKEMKGCERHVKFYSRPHNVHVPFSSSLGMDL